MCRVTLENVADVYEGEGPNIINRENMQRRIVVSLNTRDRDLNSIVAEIKQKLTAA